MKARAYLKTDVLVIGCGIAGASAALEAAKRGLEVMVITKASSLEESNTYYAQGGIVSLGPGDDPELLKEDIVRTGDGISNPEAVEILARESKTLVDEILIGTNSRDRRIAAEWVIRALSARGAVGLISTHDLALAEIVDAPGLHGRNFHFADTGDPSGLSFDYLLRPGVVERSNALNIVRQLGIETETSKFPPPPPLPPPGTPPHSPA